MALVPNTNHRRAAIVAAPDRLVSSHNACSHPGFNMTQNERASSSTRQKSNQPVTNGDLESRIAQHDADLQKALAALVKQEFTKTIGSNIKKLVQEAVHDAVTRAMKGPETRQNIIDLVQEQTREDSQNCRVTDEELQKKVEEAVQKAATSISPSPPDSANKLKKGIFATMPEMKTERGMGTIKNCVAG